MSFADLGKSAGKSEADFILFARAHIAHKEASYCLFENHLVETGRKASVHRQTDMPAIYSWLYCLATVSYGLFPNMDLSSFIKRLTGAQGTRNIWRGRCRRQSHLSVFRERASFHYKGEVQKESSSQEDWRVSTGLYRDKARAGHHRFRGSSVKRSAKRAFNSKARRVERDRLGRGNWHLLPKKFQKPWID